MERKIGEIFECDGIKLRVEKERAGCVGCYFRLHNKMWCLRQKALRGECAKVKRHTEGVIFVQIGDMEERAIKLTLEKAKEFYNKGGEFRDLALSAYSKEELIKLPETWEDFCNNYKVQKEECFIGPNSGIVVVSSGKRLIHSDQNLLPNKQAAEAHLALIKLHQLRDCYRQGWKPDYTDCTCKYYLSKGADHRICVDWCRAIDHFLTFQTEEVAQEFLDNFNDLIFKAWDLL